MATERQIAANRRNSRKSTGPRSGAGKKRAGRNAYRHGLTLGVGSTAAFEKELDNLVRNIAGDTEDAIMLERASAFGELDPPRPPRVTVSQALRVLKALVRNRGAPIGDGVTFPEPIGSMATMPSQEPDRSAEALRRVLPDLRKLDRYERRAAVRRNRAVRGLLANLVSNNL
jgi:hypothetical protein